jgi:Uma2 family endonuclease
MENLAGINNDWYEEPVNTEFIDGIEYAMAAGSIKHAEIIANLYGLLHSFFNQKPCKPFTSELEICLDENLFRPDISVICDFSKAKDNVYEGAPTLIIEVLSPRTAYMDYGKKFKYYQQHGVQEYWIVSPEYQTIQQYALMDGKFKHMATYLNAPAQEQNMEDPYKFVTAFQSYVFEDLTINLDEVFQFRMGQA